VGTYETIKTLTYTDGLLDTYRSREDEEEQLNKMKILQLEAMECLTGSKEYQARLKAVETEFETDETGGMGRDDALDSKPPGRTTRSWSQSTPKADPSKDLQQTLESSQEYERRGDPGRPKGCSRTIILSSNREGVTESPVKPESSEVVVETRDSLKTMATTFKQVAQRAETASRDRS
jgi:hypothetical protein